MSSIGSEYSGFVGKLVVHVAENGHTFEVDCEDGMSVAAVQTCLESLSGIPFNSQLLLCLDMKLEQNRSLSYYKLPSDGKELFLYNRARLVPDCSLPPSEQMEVPEIVEPPLPSPSRNPHPLDDAPDPALKALPSYERQFRYHFQKGHAIYGSTQAKFDICRLFLREQKIQEKALETARGNMDHYYLMINQMYADFMKCFSQQNRYHVDLLTNLEKDITKLRSCKLHPAFQTGSRKSLLDFIKEENLRKAAENCAGSHKQFDSKISQLKAMYSELKCRLEDLSLNKSSVYIKEVETMIKNNQHFIDEQTSVMQSLSKDVNTVKKLVDDSVSCQLSASIRPHDAVSALGPMYDVHQKSHIPKMQDCDRAIGKLLEFCRMKKDGMNLFVHTSMQKIACVQSSIRDIRLQLPAFKEAMSRQDEIFSDLKIIRRIGPAYRACLAEIVRRKSWMKLYMGLAGQLAERLARKREAEVRGRDDFLKAHVPYIPRDILASMGLFDSPSQCDVHIVPFDINLLDIDITDVDRYASQYVSMPSLKMGKNSLARLSFSTSHTSCSSGQVGEGSEDIFQKTEIGELLDETDSAEFVGTSKMEVENAWLKAELASAIALICSFGPDIDFESLDDSKIGNMMKNTAEKTAEALHLKDEYCKHLLETVKEKQMQCTSYEERIQELEQKLSEQYLQAHPVPNGKNISESANSLLKNDNYGSVLSPDPGPVSDVAPDLMDEVCGISASLDSKEEFFQREHLKLQEGMDENMADFASLTQSDSTCQLDSSMLDTRRSELLTNDKDGLDNETKKFEEKTAEIESIEGPFPTILESFDATDCSNATSRDQDALIAELQTKLADKSYECSETVSKLSSTLEEVASLRRELEVGLKLLDESQMNCAHLENCLHEAREEAHTNLCAAERRASEYNALRVSSVKIRGLFDRLQSCVTASTGVAGFAESLRSLALSLGSTVDSEDDVGADFRSCIRVLADKVGYLSRLRTELQDRCSRSRASEEHLSKELEGKNELVKSLCAKLKLEKQANKDKISFSCLEVHGIAAFVLNAGGFYEAINRDSSNYFLSAESVALFVKNLQIKPTYIIGHIVHIERKVVRSITFASESLQSDQLDDSNSLKLPMVDKSTCTSSGGSGGPTNASTNPYNLSIGSEYFVVTVAMLPDAIQTPP